MDFIHLHNHTYYSLFDGYSKPEDLAAKAKEYKQNAIAITDNSFVFGYPEFAKACEKAEVKPIFGAYMYLAARTRFDKEKELDRRSSGLILLAETQEGYQNLLMLSSLAHTEGFYYRPRIDFDLLKKYGQDLICLLGTPSTIGKSLEIGDQNKANEMLTRFQECFDNDHLFFEITRTGEESEEQTKLREQFVEFAKNNDIPLVASNATRLPNPEDHDALSVLTALRDQTIVGAPNHFAYSQELHIKSSEQMQTLFEDIPEAISNTQKIADRCEAKIIWDQDLIPGYTCPDNLNAEQYLRKLCYEGLQKRYDINLSLKEVKKSEFPQFIDKELKTPKEDYVVLLADQDKLNEDQKAIVNRLEFELQIINWMGFNSYFLIVWDFIAYAKNQGILVGPGRGSAAGALMAYALEITDIDPLKYDLLFERFMNPDRISMPDIDIDFADTRRWEVVQYVTRKYGSDKVAQVATYGTMAARAAIRDVGRAYGIELPKVDKIAKLVPGKPGTKLKEAFDVDNFQKLYDEDEDVKRIIDTSLKLEGSVRHTGTHACAVIISDEPLVQHTGLMAASGDTEIQTQFEYPPLEDIGLLKMDFLGLKNLTIMDRAQKIINKRRDPNFDINTIPFDDPDVFRLFAEGRTTGVFQFESQGMKKYLKQLRPTVFEDIIAMAALYRPGPLNSGMTDSFVKRKNGEEDVSYPHPVMKNALQNTYGVTVYQEQIMQLSKDMAGFTGGQADTLRKGMAKKIKEVIDKMRGVFIEGCQENDISEDIAKDVWEGWEKFAAYGFNKSHSACYALIWYQTAYLKNHYPVEFMASLLTSDQENSDRVVIELEEAENMGLKIIPPSVNLSLASFTVVDNETISVGLIAIKGLGENPASAIIEEREQNGTFVSLADFVTRIPRKAMNKKTLEALIKAGALDDFGERKQMLENMTLILDYGKSASNEGKDQNQVDMFSLLGNDSPEIPEIKLPEAENASKEERLGWEKEVLGMYISEHPLKDLRPYFKQSKLDSIGALDEECIGHKRRLGAMLISIRTTQTKNNDTMAFLELDDATGRLEGTVFPKVYQSLQDTLKEGDVYIFEGKIDEYRGDLKILVNNAKTIDMAKADKRSQNFLEKAKKANMWVLEFDKDARKKHLESVKELLETYPGTTPVHLIIQGKEIPTSYLIDGENDELYQKILKLSVVQVKVQ